MYALTISKEKQEQIIKISSAMCEKQKSQYLASEADLLGYGGVSLISRITGVSRVTSSMQDSRSYQLIQRRRRT